MAKRLTFEDFVKAGEVDPYENVEYYDVEVDHSMAKIEESFDESQESKDF